MNSDTVNTLADYLAAVDADWRKASGYTGRAVHKRAYWQNMAARVLADSMKALAKPQTRKPCSTSTQK